MGELGESLALAPRPDHRRVHWDPSWPRYRFDELVITVGASLVVLFGELLPTRTDANWAAVTDFDLEVLAREGWLEPALAQTLRRAVGLRNVLVHGYAAVDPSVLRDVLEHRLGDLLAYVAAIRAGLGAA